jgi:hypothetical protein
MSGSSGEMTAEVLRGLLVNLNGGLASAKNWKQRNLAEGFPEAAESYNALIKQLEEQIEAVKASIEMWSNT